jgi:hypothetical protein
MKKNIVGSAILLLYIILLPYACRLYRGMDWAAQYLPDEGHLVAGLLFFGGFASLPAIPLIAAFWLRKHVPVTFILSIVIATGFLAFWHHDYDLASDAQAAIGLIIIPLYASILTALVVAVIAVVELVVKKARKIASQVPETARKLADPLH